MINPKTFLGDSAFDSVGIYKALFKYLHFEKAYIPLNRRSKLENVDYSINEDGIPCCPNNPSLIMKHEGTSKLKSGVTRYKFICPKVVWQKGDNGKYHRVCKCDRPCTESSCGRMIYLYPDKKSVLIPVLFVVQRNGITHIKSEQLLRKTSIIIRTVIV